MPSASLSPIATYRKVGQFLRRPISVRLVIALLLVLMMPQALRYLGQRGSDVEALQSFADQGLGIKDLIQSVKAELHATELERLERNEAALFELEAFDLEISFVVRARSAGKGSVSYEFVALDSEMETGSERVQRLVLHMTAIPPREGAQRASESMIPFDTAEVTVIGGDVPPGMED